MLSVGGILGAEVECLTAPNSPLLSLVSHDVVRSALRCRGILRTQDIGGGVSCIVYGSPQFRE
jgi:hypothetical protein